MTVAQRVVLGNGEVIKVVPQELGLKYIEAITDISDGGIQSLRGHGNSTVTVDYSNEIAFIEHIGPGKNARIPLVTIGDAKAFRAWTAKMRAAAYRIDMTVECVLRKALVNPNDKKSEKKDYIYVAVTKGKKERKARGS